MCKTQTDHAKLLFLLLCLSITNRRRRPKQEYQARRLKGKNEEKENKFTVLEMLTKTSTRRNATKLFIPFCYFHSFSKVCS